MRFYFVAILTIFLSATVVAQGGTYKTITAAQSDTLIKNHQGLNDVVILDVRTAVEYNAERIEKSRNLDGNSAWFNDSIDKLDKNKIYLVYCGVGGRSPGACTKLIAKNIKTVYNMH